ncbi:hypothetical protein HFN89_01605 [Rhizobium laguerreae]|nr:hypothetical protein [Rhizobium laguerreae]
MTVTALSRPAALDISQYFAPEIINPTKRKKLAMVFSGETSKDNDDFTYGLSKHLDFPVQCYFERPYLTRELPRGIPWHNFPVVSDPYYRISLGGNGSHRSVDFNVNGEKPTSEGVLENADVLVFRNNASARRCAQSAYEMAYALEKFGHGQGYVLVDSENGAFVSTPVADLKKPMKAELRFLYSYTVNFMAIAMKAARALETDNPMRARDFAPFERVRLCGYQGIRARAEIASHPLALQWLYRLRSLGSFDVSYASEYHDFVARVGGSSGEFHQVSPYSAQADLTLPLPDGVALLRHDDGNYTIAFDQEREHDPVLAQLRTVLTGKGIKFDAVGTTARVARQLLDNSSDDGNRFFSLDHGAPTAWKGTGKHAPLAVADDVASAPLSYFAMKFVRYDEGARTIALSDKGHRFLDMLHPDCEDPDVMLRWIGDDGLFRDGVERSCDEWIMRFFSKMKTRINHIE